MESDVLDHLVERRRNAEACTGLVIKRSDAHLYSLDGFLTELQNELDLGKKSRGFPLCRLMTVPSVDEIRRAQAAHVRLLESKGVYGKRQAEEDLLALIAIGADPISTSFWMKLLQLRIPRDQFGNRRRQIAVAAVALRALLEGSAEDALRVTSLADVSDPATRAAAVSVLDRLALAFIDEAPVHKASVDALKSVSLTATDFLSRYLARDGLRHLGLSTHRDIPHGVYVFLVTYGQYAFTVELLSKMSLHDLHRAIQQHLDWDDDHLYEFFLDGRRSENRAAVRCGATPDDVDDGPTTLSTCLGDLGLVRNHEFMYLFDFGDCHRFKIKVKETRETTTSEHRYPHAEAIRGQRPEQYPSWGW